MLMPDACALCGRRGASPCVLCVRRLRQLAGDDQDELPPGLDKLWSALSYRSEARRLVGALKFHNRRTSVRWLGRQMAAMVDDHDVDCVTWVPGSGAGNAERGYEPSRLLAERVAKEMRLPVVRLLRRRRGGRQSELSRSERLAGPMLLTARLALCREPPRRVLLVDDVCTTGSSLAAAAQVLRDGYGVKVVYGVVAARTPKQAARIGTSALASVLRSPRAKPRFPWSDAAYRRIL